MTPAQSYIEQHGAADTEWLTAFIEQKYGRVIEGMQTSHSQFGVEYQEVVVFLDASTGHESMMAILKEKVVELMPDGTGLKDMTLVWRVRPMMYEQPASSPDEDPDLDLNRIKVRWRYHTMMGIIE